MDFDLRSHTLLLVVTGSRAYGIHLPTSDVDVKGVCVPPARYYHGIKGRFEQADKPGHICVFQDTLTPEERTAATDTKLEGSVYELRKFLGLALENNPNILDILFCRDEEVRVCDALGERLRAARDLFLSARSRHTFAGYAAAQLKRIRGHRAWLLDPPTHAPTRAEHGLPEYTLLPAAQLDAAMAAVRKQVDSWEMDLSGVDPATVIHVQEQVARVLAEVQTALGFPDVEAAKWLAAARLVGLDENLIYVLQKEREYDAARRHWRQYEEWKRNRNPARSALEARFHYDTKHAGHLVRLLRMGREILTTGRVHVWRGPGGAGDAEEIRAVRNGAWTFDQLVTWAELEEAELDRIYAEKRCVVPTAPDQGAIDRLCVELVETALREGRRDD